MRLLSKEIIKTLPRLFDQEHTPNKKVYAKLFIPGSSWTWYIMEYDPTSKVCFGLVDGLEKELGYFSITELKEVKGHLGLKVERDLSFKITDLKDLL